MRTCIRCGSAIAPRVSRPIMENGVPTGEPLEPYGDIHPDPKTCIDVLRFRTQRLQDRVDELEAEPVAAVVDERNQLRIEVRESKARIEQLETLLTAERAALEAEHRRRAAPAASTVNWHKMTVEPAYCGAYVGAAWDAGGDGFYYDSIFWLSWAEFGRYVPESHTRYFTGDYEWFYYEEEWPPLLVNPENFLRWAHVTPPFLDDDE